MAELLTLLDSSLAERQLSRSDLCALASSEHKRDEAGLLQLAEHLHLPISFLPAEVLAGYHGRLNETSAIALQATGSPSVAEASALALAERLNGRPAHLWINKRKSAAATLALAGPDR